jgi:hypothetical protein
VLASLAIIAAIGAMQGRIEIECKNFILWPLTCQRAQQAPDGGLPQQHTELCDTCKDRQSRYNTILSILNNTHTKDSLMKHQQHFELTHYEPAGKTVQQQLFQALEVLRLAGVGPLATMVFYSVSTWAVVV